VFCLFCNSRASSKRLERISKGHRLWHVVNKQDSVEDDWDEDWEGQEPQIHYENDEKHHVGKGGLKDLGVDVDVSDILMSIKYNIVNANECLLTFLFSFLFFLFLSGLNPVALRHGHCHC
jgi:hypothetical protein